MSKALGERLRRERTRRDERQIDAANRFGISQPSYYRWESGEARPDDSQFELIGRYIGVPVDEVWELLHGEKAEPPSLTGLREQIGSVERDVADLKATINELTAIVHAFTTPPEPPPAPALKSVKTPAKPQALRAVAKAASKTGRRTPR